jgi:hypothetical protein
MITSGMTTTIMYATAITIIIITMPILRRARPHTTPVLQVYGPSQAQFQILSPHAFEGRDPSPKTGPRHSSSYLASPIGAAHQQ